MSRLVDLVRSFAGRRVLLAGDFMLDRYVFGRVERVSPEAPIPVLRWQRDEARLGGAGFVAAQLAALGGKIAALGVVGDDACGAQVRAKLDEAGCATDGLLLCPDRPTVDKLRLLGSSEDRTHQQLLRLDTEQPRAIPDDVSDRLLARAETLVAECDAVAIEDYDKGVLPPRVCARLIALAREHGKPVVVDPARLADYGKYAGASLVKFNRVEAARALGLPALSSKDAPDAARALADKLDLSAVVVTLNEAGSYLHQRLKGTGAHLAGRPRPVADATGAGDVVLAVLALAAAGGAPWPDAVALANAAAGLEVEKVGCQALTADEIVADLLSEDVDARGKLRVDLAQLDADLARHRALGRKIVFTNGCFDLVHLGHVQYFRFAKAQGDVLVVGVNTDASIQRLKGPKRPLVPEADRVGVLEELESIDYLVPFGEDTPIELIKRVRPDVLVKGADYTVEQVVGHDFVSTYGGRVALAPLVQGRSTTNVIGRVLEVYGTEPR